MALVTICVGTTLVGTETTDNPSSNVAEDAAVINRHFCDVVVTPSTETDGSFVEASVIGEWTDISRC